MNVFQRIRMMNQLASDIDKNREKMEAILLSKRVIRMMKIRFFINQSLWLLWWGFVAVCFILGAIQIVSAIVISLERALS